MINYYNGVWHYGQGITSAYSPIELVRIRQQLIKEIAGLRTEIDRLTAEKSETIIREVT